MNTIRNFSIIAHIDHGKSTLADRFLEITATVPPEKLTPQYLDRLELERERGITIKLAPVTMKFKAQNSKFKIRDNKIQNSEFILNLIDTPGHVDFSYEVSRSLACVEGAVLLVDATKGIEAQTLSNYFLAKDQNLKIIPVINKIDLPNAQTEKTQEQIVNSLGFAKSEILKISAKTGEGVTEVLETIIKKIPSPKVDQLGVLRALVFDSFFDQFKGVVAYVRIFNGGVRRGDKIRFVSSGQEAEVASIGLFLPQLKEKEELRTGEIGWLATGIKEIQKVRVGDTVTLSGSEGTPLPGYKEFKPMVFAGIFPINRDDFRELKVALEKLKLNDASLVFEPENSPALGFGVRAGFLGLLHMEIVQERLEREFGLELILTSPTARYKVIKTGGEEIEVSNPQRLPDQSKIKEILEPWVKGQILSLSQYYGQTSQLLYEHRAEITNTEYFTDKIKIDCFIPLSEVIFQFFDQLKTSSSGFTSFDYELADYRPIEAVKLEILIAKERVDALSQIVIKEKSYHIGKALVEKLKEAIPRQQFEVSLQAVVGGKFIATEKIPAFRKDVTAKLYGGDRTRKDKLLQKQQAGKKRLKKVGRVDIPQEAFLSVLKI